MSLLPGERAVIEVLKEAGLLHDMKKRHFCGKEDVIMICCPDGRQFMRSIANPFMDMYDEAHKVQFHPLPRHGGTLLLDKNSSLVLPGHTTDKDFIHDIKDAMEMGYKAICLVNHFPCSMARKHNVSPIDIVESLINSKKRIKEEEGITKVTIACFLQVTDGGKRYIYYISSNEYLSWKDRLGNEAIQQLVAEATK